MTNSRTAKNWRKRVGGIELDLPSGNTALVTRPGMDKLLKAGIMPDALTPIAMEHLRKAESGGRITQDDDAEMNAKLMEQIMQDPSQMTEIFMAFDRVLEMCVVEPKVALHLRKQTNEDGSDVLENGKPVWEEIPQDERLSDEVPEEIDGEPNPLYRSEEDCPIYTDEVDQDDKTFIFQWAVGGTADLETFRREQAATLASAQSG